MYFDVFPRFLFAIKTCWFPAHHHNYGSWWPVQIYVLLGRHVFVCAWLFVCMCNCICVAFLPAGTDSLSTNIMTLFPSAQDCRSLQVFLPLLLLMRNHRIYVYMKLAVFLFALCFICFHPQRGFVSQWHSCAARNNKKNNKKPFWYAL